MNPDEVRRLLARYSTGSLTDAERQALFAAALDDQELFDELAQEDQLKQLIDTPGVRDRLLVSLALKQQPVSFWQWVRQPWPLGAMAGVATLALVWLVIQMPYGQITSGQMPNGQTPDGPNPIVADAPVAAQPSTVAQAPDISPTETARSRKPAPAQEREGVTAQANIPARKAVPAMTAPVAPTPPLRQEVAVAPQAIGQAARQADREAAPLIAADATSQKAEAANPAAARPNPAPAPVDVARRADSVAIVQGASPLAAPVAAGGRGGGRAANTAQVPGQLARQTKSEAEGASRIPTAPPEQTKALALGLANGISAASAPAGFGAATPFGFHYLVSGGTLRLTLRIGGVLSVNAVDALGAAVSLLAPRTVAVASVIEVAVPPTAQLLDIQLMLAGPSDVGPAQQRTDLEGDVVASDPSRPSYIRARVPAR